MAESERQAPPAPVTSDPAADEPHIIARNRPVLFFAIMAAAILQVLDSTIANVALPHMQSSLGATSDSITWVLTSYIVASAIALPTTGWMAGRIGNRRLLLIAVTGFIGFSALCGVAQSLTEMVLFRIGQGLAGAYIMPLSQTIMLDITRPSQHAQAMGVWAMGVVAGPIAGPIIGGYLTENFDWRWVFFVNVPIGLLALVLLTIHLPMWEKVRTRFDRLGFALVAIAIASLQLMLDRGEQVDWFDAAELWIYLALFLSCSFAAVSHMVLAGNPLFERAIFANRNFSIALVIIFMVGLCLYATLALLPPMLQGLFGYSVLDTGFVLAPRGVGVMMCMPLSQWLVKRGLDSRVLVGGGFLITGFSMIEMAHWSLAVDSRHIIIAGLMQGVGIGFTFLPLQTLAFSTLAPRLRASASAMLNLSRSIGSSIGISIVVTLLARNIQINHLELGANVRADLLPTMNFPALSRIDPLGPAALQMLDAEVNRQAAMIAYLDDFWLMGIACFITMPLVLLIRPSRQDGAG